jgi:hypothetical protein
MEQGPEVTTEIAETCQQYRPTYVPGFGAPGDSSDRPSCETCEYWGRGKCGSYRKALASANPSDRYRDDPE